MTKKKIILVVFAILSIMLCIIIISRIINPVIKKYEGLEYYTSGRYKNLFSDPFYKASISYVENSFFPSLKYEPYYNDFYIYYGAASMSANDLNSLVLELSFSNKSDFENLIIELYKGREINHSFEFKDYHCDIIEGEFTKYRDMGFSIYKSGIEYKRMGIYCINEDKLTIRCMFVFYNHGDIIRELIVPRIFDCTACSWD